MRIRLRFESPEMLLKDLPVGSYFTFKNTGGVFRKTDCKKEDEKPFCVCMETGQLLWFLNEDRVVYVELANNEAICFDVVPRWRLR